MVDPSRLRDSTQIIVPRSAYEGIREEIHDRFTVSVVEYDAAARIIGSPVEIKQLNAFLTRQGISLP